jgi:putative ABC transport system permease protein
MGENWANLVQFKLQSVRDIHLYSDRLHEVANTMDVKQLKYLSGISLLILLMAGLNFMNIYSARAEYRSKEVGLKKLFGAKRFNLIFQFLSESILYTLISILISISIIIFLNSFLENLTQSQFKLEFTNTIFILVIILVFIGVISGLYPAIYLSSFKPLNTIKGIFRSKKSGSSLRKVLTIIQLSLALFMIFATFVVYLQMKYIRNKDLGFDHANLLSLSLNTRELFTRNKMLKDEFSKFSGVKDICFSSSRIDNILAGQRSYVLKDSSSSENNMDYMIRTIFVDENYIPLYDIKINDGRNFSLEYPTDIDNSIIINESGAKLLGLSNPVGKQVISYYNDSNYVFNIIGVMKDFNYQSLHTPIEPLFFRFRDNNFSVMTIKASDKEIQETVKFSENKMNELSPDYPISTEILSDEINTHYDKEKRISTIYQLLTFLSIFIACLGLFGIISFILEKKTKETGIKKVLGASNRDLFFSLSKDLLLWLSFAAIVSFPIGYYIMEKWLDRFAYKTTLYWWLFPLSFLLIFLVSFITISYKTLKAIRSNPIDSLRYE